MKSVCRWMSCECWGNELVGEHFQVPCCEALWTYKSTVHRRGRPKWVSAPGHTAATDALRDKIRILAAGPLVQCWKFSTLCDTLSSRPSLVHLHSSPTDPANASPRPAAFPPRRHLLCVSTPTLKGHQGFVINLTEDPANDESAQTK